MSELSDIAWDIKYRPQCFDELILEHKDTIQNALKNPKSIPSMIFYSSKPGTGKTSTAMLISRLLECDTLTLNASKERGIDTIRDKVTSFAQALSSDETTKRLTFLDEADFITAQAQASMRNLIETYADNCFFIFTANDLNKIIEPIRSRCIVLNFENPNKQEILNRLEYICEKESVEYDVEDLSKLVDMYYPDLRAMILQLQICKIDNKSILIDYADFKLFINALRSKDISYIYSKTFSKDFNILAFNKYMFKYLFENQQVIGFEGVAKSARYLADTEKAWNLGSSLEIVFLANIMQVAEFLK